MSFKRPRVHLTGKSNADVRTISTTPVKTRIPIHERTFVMPSPAFNKLGEDPIETSMQKYKTWNKKIRSLSGKETSNQEFKMKHDPPDYAKLKKIENKEKKNFEIDKLQEQLVNHLKSSGFNANAQFIKADKYKNGLLSFEDFKQILESTNLPLEVSKNLKSLYTNLGGNHEGINYKNLSTITPTKASFKLPDLDFQVPLENKLKIIDKRTAPLNQLEKIYKNGLKVRQFLKSIYKSSDILLKDLQSHHPNNRITMENLKDFVVDKLNEHKSIKVNKKEMEGFLSSYDYNKDTDTGINEVVEYVFMDDLVAGNHLHHKKRAVPPIRNALKFEKVDETRLKKLLMDIDHKMFTQGPAQNLSVFRSFDKDGDGYITIEDIEQGLTLASIDHTPEDSRILFAFLDDNQNGYVTFSEFSKKIQPNILTVNREKFNEDEEKHFNISQPSTKYHLLQQSKLYFWKPEEAQEHKLTLNTRYSASPAHQDTFYNFEAKPNTAMFISESERLGAKKFDPINMHHIDKQKIKKNKDARILYIQKTRENHHDRIKDIEERERIMDASKIEKSYKVKQEYEIKCKTGMIN